jgi:prophage DNA circulation protein
MPLSIVPQSSLLGSQGQQLPVANPKAGSPTTFGLASGAAWRSRFKRASFRGAEFYVDTAVRESGRRVVEHEFPKRNVPYAEDMGRRKREFTVRGYMIVFPNETLYPFDQLKKKNYIIPRDKLIVALEEDGPADLQLPFLGVLNVMAMRYRITEEDRYGGYCVFDMTFTEFGQAPATGTRDSAAGVAYGAQKFGDATQTGITNQIKAIDAGTAV